MMSEITQDQVLKDYSGVREVAITPEQERKYFAYLKNGGGLARKVNYFVQYGHTAEAEQARRDYADALEKAKVAIVEDKGPKQFKAIQDRNVNSYTGITGQIYTGNDYMLTPDPDFVGMVFVKGNGTDCELPKEKIAKLFGDGAVFELGLD
jgi:hypothetical protein